MQKLYLKLIVILTILFYGCDVLGEQQKSKRKKKKKVTNSLSTGQANLQTPKIQKFFWNCPSCKIKNTSINCHNCDFKLLDNKSEKTFVYFVHGMESYKEVWEIIIQKLKNSLVKNNLNNIEIVNNNFNLFRNNDLNTVLENNITTLKELINQHPNCKIYFVCHSLGGILATLLTKNPDIFPYVKKIIALGSPLGGFFGMSQKKYIKRNIPIVTPLLNKSWINSNIIFTIRNFLQVSSNKIYLFGGKFANAAKYLENLSNKALNEKLKKGFNIGFTVLSNLINQGKETDGIVALDSALLTNYFPYGSKNNLKRSSENISHTDLLINDKVFQFLLDALSE